MTSQQPRQAVLFDLDDTLVNTREIKWNHHRYVAKNSFDFELTDEILHKYWGIAFDEMIDHYYGHRGTAEERRAANAACKDMFQKEQIPGARQVVENLLDAGIAVGIVTSTLTEWAQEELVKGDYPVEKILLVQGSDITGVHKPNPAVFDEAKKILAQEGIEKVTYVGDSLLDQDAALAAGFNFIAVEQGLFKAEEFKPGIRVLQNITDINQDLL